MFIFAITKEASMNNLLLLLNLVVSFIINVLKNAEVNFLRSKFANITIAFIYYLFKFSCPSIPFCKCEE